jgi:hypothetical protein
MPAIVGCGGRWRFLGASMAYLYQPLQPLAADGGALVRVLHAVGVETDDLIAGAVSAGGALIVQTRPGQFGDEFEVIAALLRGQDFQTQRRPNDKGAFPAAEKAA